jgi:hypothetical protein
MRKTVLFALFAFLAAFATAVQAGNDTPATSGSSCCAAAATLTPTAAQCPMTAKVKTPVATQASDCCGGAETTAVSSAGAQCPMAKQACVKAGKTAKPVLHSPKAMELAGT